MSIPIPIFFPRSRGSADSEPHSAIRYNHEVHAPLDYIKYSIERWEGLPSYFLGDCADKKEAHLGIVTTRLYASIYNNPEVIRANHDLLDMGVNITYVLNDSKIGNHPDLDAKIDGYKREQKHNLEAGVLALSWLEGLGGKMGRLKAIASPEKKEVNYWIAVQSSATSLLVVEKPGHGPGYWNLFGYWGLSTWTGNFSNDSVSKFFEDFTSVCKEAAGSISNSPQELKNHLEAGRKTELTSGCLKGLNMGETKQQMRQALS